MKNYTNALVEIIYIDQSDVIATSIPTLDGGDGDFVGYDQLFG